MCLAVPGQVLSVSSGDPRTRTGRVSFGGAVKEVNLAYLPDVQPGQYVIVHVGFAISVVDEQEAAAALAVFQELEGWARPAGAP